MTEITVTTQYTPAEPAIAIAAIRDLVATVERVQQHELVEEFVALFRSDAIWTTGAGKQLLGRDAIADFTAQVLPGWTAQGNSATYEVEHVLFIRADVAAVKVKQQYFTPAGEPDTAGTPMYVVAKEEGHWLLTANQNTPVVTD